MQLMPNQQQNFEDGVSAYQNNDYVTAVKLLTPVAEMGEKDAQSILGIIYEFGDEFITPDPEQALHWYNKAAQQGQVNALFNLGILCQTGKFVAQDFKKAVQLFSQAAQRGNPEAQCNLAILYAQGLGIEQDTEH